MTDKTSADTVWTDDRLNREEDAEFLLSFLSTRSHQKAVANQGSYVLNLDAAWGQGKTFFMTRFAEFVRDRGHPIVFLNAWEDDHADDPLTAIMAEIDQYITNGNAIHTGSNKKVLSAYQSVRSNYKEMIALGLQSGGKRWAKYLIGEGVDEIADLTFEQDNIETQNSATEAEKATAESLSALTDAMIDRYAATRIAAFKKAKTSFNRFRHSLGALILSIHNNKSAELPMFILIDELDRCRPLYAIAMLERIKHLFDVNNIVFILSTDTKQMMHSIKAIYGNEFDSGRYLQRFFDRTYELPRPDRVQIIKGIIDENKVDLDQLHFSCMEQDFSFLVQGFDARLNLSIRELEKALDMLSTLTTTTTRGRGKIPFFIAFPLIIGFLRRENISNYWLDDGYLKKILENMPAWDFTETWSSDGHRVVKDRENFVAFMRKAITDMDNSVRSRRDALPGFRQFRGLQDVWLANYLDNEAHTLAQGDVFGLSMALPDLIRRSGRILKNG
ncbi:KAP family P-loop NTPase fold protein [Jiella pelagia]|uniref:P-loop NTPase fold protein n=1 Tax=Jiella pelagia TaxID=2986949 RepID=A0ABY7C2F1_9HYPH|nr:P-loop NTPase fold protein [Jiella pelagia]WAP70267.1 P-loop NTPase fold protein [Jiella pelagia]